MTIHRLLATLAAFAACTMMLALVWVDPDPWHGAGQIAILPLVVGGIGSMVELGRDARLRPFAFLLAFGFSSAGLSAAFMAPHAERWTALVIAAVGAVATVFGTWQRARQGAPA